MNKFRIVSSMLVTGILLSAASIAAAASATFCQKADGTLFYRSSGNCPRLTSKVNVAAPLRGARGPAPEVVSSFSGRTNNSIADGDFIPVVGIQAPTNNEYDIEMVLPPICAHVTRLTASTAAIPGAGNTWTFTLRRDHASTDLSCSTVGETNLCSGTGSIENSSPGQTYFSVLATATAGTPDPALAYVTIECD